MRNKNVQMPLFDTTGIESYVTENNPKFMSTKLRQAKSLAKLDPDFDPYKGVYALLPDHAEKNPAVKQQYINGHFCFDENGTPLCPIDKTPMTYPGKSGGKKRSPHFKWVCHKSVRAGTKRVCSCEHPCTNSSYYGKCVYTYPHKNLRLYPGIARGADEWEALYKKRVFVERTIYSFKEYGCVSHRKTSNPATTKANLLLSGIVQLIG